MQGIEAVLPEISRESSTRFTWPAQKAQPLEMSITTIDSTAFPTGQCDKSGRLWGGLALCWASLTLFAGYTVVVTLLLSVGR